jgi:hypothetical protein
MSAEAAPKSVARPRTSVRRFLVLILSRCPTNIPRPAPPIIATTLINVPIPGNIGEE